ncbi:hypothetical protein GCM10010469_19370 [Streptomyces labedae]|uniref:Uncharacterized protein n=1 Tax=Streptomyces labedae TaxID=285569 RepID=A0ABP6QY21_9ACTN
MARFLRRQGFGRRRIGDRPLAVRRFEEFVTGHGCLGVVILLWGRQCAAELCPGSVFPTPYPQGYGGTPPWPRSRANREAGSPEHARGSAHDATVAGLYRRFAGYSLDI